MTFAAFAESVMGVGLLPQRVGWVEPFAKPITPVTAIDGYRFAPPILRPAQYHSAACSASPSITSKTFGGDIGKL
jgi:hypothetical protein